MVEASPPALIPTRAICPTCGLPPARDVTSRAGALVTATYLCPLDHLWITKWTDRT